MKATIGLCFFILAWAVSNAAQPQYIAAIFTIDGEFSARTHVLLTAGKPAKVEWKGRRNGEPDYTLLIPSPSLEQGEPDVYALLFMKHPDQRWTAISEATSLTAKGDRLLGVVDETAKMTIDIDAEITTKEAFVEKYMSKR